MDAHGCLYSLTFPPAVAHPGVEIASVLPLYRWSGPDEDERQAVVRYWKRAIRITAELGCTLMNSEFNGRPERSAESEAQFWRSMEELLPVFEREGVALNLEAHPDDFVELNAPAVDLVRAIDQPWVNYLYCAPHTFHLSDGTGDIGSMMAYAGDKLRHVHIADSFNHKGSSGLRYIVNPPGSPVRVHQHLDIGQGEVDWDAFFGTLRSIKFDGVATVCVFGWEERAVDSSRFMLERVTKELSPTPCVSSERRRSEPLTRRAVRAVRVAEVFQPAVVA
ncbi:MAG: sugar phosphate isomerase/epimerase family protein [Umezawaea sp.]